MTPRFRASVFLGLFSIAAPALPDDRTAAALRGGASITADELLAEIAALPAQAQSQVLARPADLAQFAQGLLIRRELARQAEAGGLLNDAAVSAAARAARERVLAEAALRRLEGSPPDAAALERLARNQYDATPEKFDVPEQVRVRHILIGARACEPEKRAREVLALAREPGANFAALAKANSDDPGSAAQGGDVGFFARGRMAAAFEAAAFALKEPGELSDVVKTEFGYHVIRLEERKPGGRQPFEAVRDGLVKSLADGEARSRRQRVLDGLNANIEFDGETLDAVLAARRAGAKAN